MLDYDAAAIAAEYARHRQVHPGVLCDLMETSGLGSGSRVLEVGCGTGNYIKALARLTGCRAHGIDPSGEMLGEAARDREGVSFQLTQVLCNCKANRRKR